MLLARGSEGLFPGQTKNFEIFKKVLTKGLGRAILNKSTAMRRMNMGV